MSEHYKRFLHRAARLYQQSMQHYIAKESNLHDRALQAVRSVSTPGKDEPETKEIIADVLRGFLLLENASLTGSEQVFVFGVAGKSYAYNHIANALRETWGNDERLRSHDNALSQQLQSGHLAGGVHWSADDNQRTETCYDGEESVDLWSSEWCDTDGYDKEYLPEEPDWNENYYETSDYDNNDSTFSEHIPALLDQPVETREEDTSKLETLQEAMARANAAADMSRRTCTQARQLMKDVHRSRGYFPVSKGNSMDVDQGKGKSRGKKRRFRTGKEKPREKGKGKSKGRRPGPCLLCQGPHWSRDCPSHHGGKGKRTVSSGKGYKKPSPFKQAYLESDRSDWITGAGAYAIWFPSLQNFASFDLQGKFILDSGATMSMGGVDLEQKFQEIYADAGLQLTSHPVLPLHFSFANGQEDVSTSVLPVPYLPWKVIFYIRVLNAPGPVLLGADVHEDLGLVVDHVDCSVFLSHLKLEDTVERLPSRHLA